MPCVLISGLEVTIILGLSYVVWKLRKGIEKREKFAGIVSHELKNPLTSIKLYAQVMEKQGASTTGGAISQEVDRITAMTDTLFNYTRLAQGKYILKSQKFDLIQLVNDRLRSFSVVYPDRQINFNHNPSKAKVFTDKVALDQILTNLLTNAIRYSKESITVTVDLIDNAYEVKVSDRGNGLPPEVVSVIWEAFSKPSDKGLGLGLFIVKQFSDSLNLKLSFETSTKGTTFVVVVPKL